MCVTNRYNDIENISKEYAVEKVELGKALADLKEVEDRKAELLEEKRLEEVCVLFCKMYLSLIPLNLKQIMLSYI